MAQNSVVQVDKKQLQYLQDVANRLRIHSIRATDASNSGWVIMFNLYLVMHFDFAKYS